MSVFAICFPFVLENEAADPPSYNSVPDAPDGSFAIAGINSHYWPADYDRIAALPLADRPGAVADFYQRNFWNQWLEQIASNTLAAMVMDSGVNQGSGTACKVLQTACNTLSDGRPMLAEDGIFGPATIARVNELIGFLIPVWVQARVARYNEVQRDPRTQAALIARAKKVPNFK